MWGHRCARPPSRPHCGAGSAELAAPRRPRHPPLSARRRTAAGSGSGSGGGGALSPGQQHVEQPLTLAAAALRWVESARHLGARTLGIEIPLQPYPLLDRLDDGSLHLLELSGLAVEVG